MTLMICTCSYGRKNGVLLGLSRNIIYIYGWIRCAWYKFLMPLSVVALHFDCFARHTKWICFVAGFFVRAFSQLESVALCVGTMGFILILIDMKLMNWLCQTTVQRPFYRSDGVGRKWLDFNGRHYMGDFDPKKVSRNNE